MTAPGERLAHGRLAAPLAGDIGVERARVGADARDMDEFGDPRRRGGAGDRAGAGRMHRLVGLAAALALDARGVDDGVGALERRGDRIRIAQVRLHRLDLADDAERAEEAGEVGPPDRDPDAPAVARQRPDDVPADEAGAAENSRQTIGAGENSAIFASLLPGVRP